MATSALEARIDRVDRHVSARVRERRVALGLALHELAAAIGVTFQQQFKYETGVSRIAAGRLASIAAALGTSVGWFFEGINHPDDGSSSSASRRLLELVRLFESMSDGDQQLMLQISAALATRTAPRVPTASTGANADVEAT
jgi:transcriptional regulator with XRE-family HTH domain